MDVTGENWKRLKQWNDRLLARSDFKGIMLTEVRITSCSQSGWEKLQRLRAKAVTNLSVLEQEAGKSKKDKADIEALRMYYRQYKSVLLEIDRAMEYIEKVMVAKGIELQKKVSEAK